MRVSLAALAALFSFAVASPALAGWGALPTGVPVSTAFGDQHLPRSTPDGAGGVFVVWVDLRSGGYDLYAQHVDASGAPLWTVNGVPVCTAAGLQDLPVLVADGSGGAIVAWEDVRGASYDIYAQRLAANGTPQWTPNGVLVCGATDEQSAPTIVSDGQGGAIVAWTDLRGGVSTDVYAQRLNGAGAAQWAGNGVALCTAPNDQYAPSLVSDGAGGAIAVWNDLRSGSAHDIYARRISAAGVPQWTANGVAVCAAADEQLSPVACGDGAGGVIVAWSDRRSGYFDIYAQRIASTGAAQWPTDGVPVCVAGNDQENPAIVADGANGAFVAWEDARSAGVDDLYAQHLGAGGSALWTANGVAVCTAPGAQQDVSLVGDARGGVIAGWMDGRGADFDVYAQRLDGLGAVQWPVNGLALCSAAGAQIYPVFAADASGGAIAVWEDARSGPRDVYAQRVEAHGVLGGPEPAISSLVDVPGDQGGAVVVRWRPSLYESAAYGATVTGYRLYRVDGAVRTLLYEAAATGDPEYEANAATLADSTPVAANRTRFRVAALAGALEYLGAPDSIASVDNIAPPLPEGLLVLRSGGQNRLSWQRSPAADFEIFRIYRGDYVLFAIVPAAQAGATADTQFVETAAADAYYKLVAVDRHGNASLAAWAQSETTVDAPLPASPVLSFARPEPNPSRGPALLRFSLPAASAVTLEVFDEHGRRVRSLLRGELAAGAHTVAWDGRADGGAELAPGAYFARLAANGEIRTQRLTRVR